MIGSNSEKLILRFLKGIGGATEFILLTWVVSVYDHFKSGSLYFMIGLSPLTLVFDDSSRHWANVLGSMIGWVSVSADSCLVRFLWTLFSTVLTSSLAAAIGLEGKAAFITEIPAPIDWRFRATAFTASSSLKFVVFIVSGLRRSLYSFSRSRSRKNSSRVRCFFSSFTKNFCAWDRA